MFVEPKSESSKRTFKISVKLVELLRTHRQHQAELKMRNRATYHDHGLVFAKESSNVCGDPLQMNNLGQREFARLIEKSEVRAIKFHGMRHTAATLALSAGVPVKLVAHMLGHSKTAITLDTYTHATEDIQEQAAEAIDDVLGGKR